LLTGLGCIGAKLLTICLLTSSAQAGDRTLLELLKVLHKNGTISHEAYEMLHKTALEEDKEGRTKGEAGSTAKPHNISSPSSITHDTNTVRNTDAANIRLGSKGLEVESADGDFRFGMGGRLLLDAAWYDQDGAELNNDAELRSSRLTWRGLLWKDWQFKSEVEFAQNGADLKSNFLRYRGFDPLLITFGNFKEPFGLERWTSITETTFMERAAVSNALAPARSLGLGVRTGARKWTLASGLFGARDQGEGGNSDREEESWAVTGRATYLPIVEPNGLLHTGVAFSYRHFDDGQIRFKARPESYVSDAFFVDTGSISEVESLTRYGIEAAAVLGPLSLQTEYITTQTRRVDTGPILTFDGWYAYASYLISGETRPYRHRRGVFRGIRPRHAFGRGGPGAWELALRYSQLDLSDDDISGGELKLMTFGLNWYPNANVRLSTNYNRVLETDRAGSPFDGDEPQFIQFRSQVDF
jgi:phosphate-selective porin OprO/OprP